jgi:hypothetical protein
MFVRTWMTSLLLGALWAATAAATGFTLNWNQCVGAGSLSNQTFDCGNPSAEYGLVLEIRPPSRSQFFAIDLDLEIIETTHAFGEAIDPFWHYENGGCNQGGLTISNDSSSLGAGAVGCLPTISGPTGAESTALITAYGVGYGGPNRARMLLTVARPFSSPISLVEGENYFVAQLLFSMANSCASDDRRCYGCTQGLTITWHGATLYSTVGPPVTVCAGPQCVTVNGGPLVCEPNPPGPGSCGEPAGLVATSVVQPENDCSKEVTSVRHSTWGAIKSLYR